MTFYNILSTFIEGILAFISPCFLPMLPVYFSYLSGHNNEGDNNNKLIYNSIGFILGFTFVFVISGLTATTFSRFLQAHKDVIMRIGGIILIVLGINMTEIFNLKLINKDTRKINGKPITSMLEAFLFGIAIAFGWSPCLGSFLLAALVTAGNQDTIIQGGFLLFTFSMGLAVPFIITALLFKNMKEVFNGIKKHYKIINFVSGLFLIIMGLLMLFNKFSDYTNIFY